MNILLIVASVFAVVAGIFGLAHTRAAHPKEERWRWPFFVLSGGILAFAWVIVSWTHNDGKVIALHAIQTVKDAGGNDVHVIVIEGARVLNINSMMGVAPSSGAMVKEISYNGWNYGIYWGGICHDFVLISSRDKAAEK